jgi:hypothetical protein
MKCTARDDAPDHPGAHNAVMHRSPMVVLVSACPSAARSCRSRRQQHPGQNRTRQDRDECLGMSRSPGLDPRRLPSRARYS